MKKKSLTHDDDDDDDDEEPSTVHFSLNVSLFPFHQHMAQMIPSSRRVDTRDMSGVYVYTLSLSLSLCTHVIVCSIYSVDTLSLCLSDSQRQREREGSVRVCDFALDVTVQIRSFFSKPFSL